MSTCEWCGSWPYGHDCPCYEPCVCGRDSAECDPCPIAADHERRSLAMARSVGAAMLEQSQAAEMLTEMAVGG